MKFSVLMAVYYKENPNFLDLAIKSIYENQTVKPNEIVLVKDGPLTKELDQTIDKWEKKLPFLFKVISLKKNRGLAYALNRGIKECSYEYIARMDSDDISYPNRFKKQINFLEKNPDIDVLGGWISEFANDDEEDIYADRKVPISTKDVVSFAKFRCPVNHVTVMYKKSAVLSVQGYDKFIGIEDYYLWAKMFIKGYKFFNLPEYLVNVRAGENMLQRRRGFHYAKMEFLLQIEFYKIGFITLPVFVQNTLAKFIIRIAPLGFMDYIYKKLRRVTYYKNDSDRNIYFNLKYKNIQYGE